VTAFDWSAKSSEAIVDKVVRKLIYAVASKARLFCSTMADIWASGVDRSHTVVATGVLLEKYAGKRFVTVSELKMDFAGDSEALR